MKRRPAPTIPYLASPVPVWIARAVGVLAFLIGLLFLGLSLLGVFRMLTGGATPAHRSGLSLALLIAATIGILGAVIGVRLVTGRSPHGDSLLSRMVWTLLGIGFVVAGSTIGIATHWDSDLLVGILSSAIFAVGCFGVASRPRRT